MPTIQIGAPVAHHFGDPLGVLTDCHRRVEHFLQILVTVAWQARGGALTDEQHDALEVGLRYFVEAAPKHTADEEESLFPRLRRSSHPRAADALALVDVLARDHEVARAHHARVEALGRCWLNEGTLPPAMARELATRLADLTTLYRRHIPVEDLEVIPLARELLAPTAIAALGREMALRRGLDPYRVGVDRAAAAANTRRQGE